jgi:hypothetical protein
MSTPVESPYKVPPEIAVCPECGGPIEWRLLSDEEDYFCFCSARELHPPNQAPVMLWKWNETEVAVAKWVKSLKP